MRWNKLDGILILCFMGSLVFLGHQCLQAQADGCDDKCRERTIHHYSGSGGITCLEQELADCVFCYFAATRCKPRDSDSPDLFCQSTTQNQRKRDRESCVNVCNVGVPVSWAEAKDGTPTSNFVNFGSRYLCQEMP